MHWPSGELKDLLQHGLMTFGLLIILRIILAFAGIIPFVSLGMELLLDTGILIITILILFFWLLFRIRGPFASLVDIQSSLDKPIKKEFLKYIQKDIEAIYTKLINLKSKSGALFFFDDYRNFTDVFFELGSGSYYGTDSNVPSQFNEKNPNYLDAQENNISTLGGESTRILLITQEDFDNDLLNYSNQCVEFCLWHYQNKVTLKLANPKIAVDLSKKHHLPNNITDIGLWENYALLFDTKSGPDKRNIYMRMKEETDYKNVEKYFQELNSPQISEIALDLDYILKIICNKMSLIKSEENGNTSRRLFDEELAINWDKFVNCEQRLRTEGPFLDNLISQLKKEDDFLVFDAALGIGCESIYLLQKNINLISNEISPTLKLLALMNAQKSKLKLNITSWDWRNLEKEFSQKYKEKKVNMALLLGNSLCLLLNAEDRLSSLNNLHAILAPGGVLVIDERNFHYILDNRSSILKDPIKNFKYKGDVMYCGLEVKGTPTEINNNSVVFSYYQTKNDQVKFEELSSNTIGKLKMYPFKKGELEKLLIRAGFKVIAKYYDFNTMPSKDDDFFIYVAQKESPAVS